MKINNLWQILFHELTTHKQSNQQFLQELASQSSPFCSESHYADDCGQSAFMQIQKKLSLIFLIYEIVYSNIDIDISVGNSINSILDMVLIFLNTTCQNFLYAINQLYHSSFVELIHCFSQLSIVVMSFFLETVKNSLLFIWDTFWQMVLIIKSATLFTLFPISILPHIVSYMLPPMILFFLLIVTFRSPTQVSSASNPKSVIVLLLCSAVMLTVYTLIFSFLSSILILPSVFIQILVCLIFISNTSKSAQILAVIVMCNLHTMSLTKGIIFMMFIAFVPIRKSGNIWQNYVKKGLHFIYLITSQEYSLLLLYTVALTLAKIVQIINLQLKHFKSIRHCLPEENNQQDEFKDNWDFRKQWDIYLPIQQYH